MSEESRNHVFLCHSSVDKPFVRLLAHDLAERGIQVWLDEWELRVGDSLRERIEQAILQSGWLAVVISHASVGSAWVQRELSAALTDELERRSVFVLPVILDDAPIPLFLRDKIYADFRKDYAIGFRALKSRLLPVPKDSPKRRIIYDGDEEDIPFDHGRFCHLRSPKSPFPNAAQQFDVTSVCHSYCYGHRGSRYQQVSSDPAWGRRIPLQG